MKATGRVNRPISISAPPTSSSTPAAPRSDTNCRLSKGSKCGKPKNFAVPCCRSMSAVTTRSTESRRGDQVLQKSSITAAPLVSGLLRSAVYLGTIADFASLRRRRFAFGLHFGGVIVHQLRRYRARREAPMRDLRDRRHFGGTAGDEAFREAGELIGHDAPLDHLDAAPLGELDRGLAGDAVQETVGDRRVNLAVLDEEDIGASALGDAALPVEHHGIRIAFTFCLVLGNGADRVEAGGLGERGRGLGIGPAIVGKIEPDALEALHRIEVARPLPGGDGEMNLVVLRGDAHLLGTAPGDRPHIGVFLAVSFEHQALGRVDLGDRVGDFEIEYLRRALEPLRMGGALENFAAIGAFALEHRARVMQPVRAHMQRGIAPGNKRAVIPDDAIEPVVGLIGHDCLRRVSAAASMCTAAINVRLSFARYAFASGANTRYGSVAPQERAGSAPL